MEYLMTYGWAILIIAIVMVALFSLGILNPTQNYCLAQVGFLCKNLVFSAALAPPWYLPSVTVNLGTTNGPWSSADFVIVPQGEVITDTSQADASNPDDFYYWGYSSNGRYYQVSGTLEPGQLVNAQIFINPDFSGLGSTPPTIGTKLTGEIWVMYTYPGGTQLLSEVAVFSTVATTD